MPQEQPLEALAEQLQETDADTLVVGAGAVPLNELVKLHTGLKHVIWVVARTSRHMDWHEVPEGEGGKASIAVWHEIIDDVSEPSELPASIPGETCSDVLIVSKKGTSGHEVVELSQGVSTTWL